MNKLILSTIIVFCLFMAVLLIRGHQKKRLYHNAFKTALSIVPQIEESSSRNISLSDNFVSCIEKELLNDNPKEVVFNVMHYFKTHGSSPSSFSLESSKLRFRRKLPNSNQATEFRLVFKDGIWMLDSVSGIKEIISKIQAQKF